MADSIMDSVLAMVTPEMQQSLAARLAEAPQPVYRGLSTAAAATLDGLASKAGDPVFITDTLNLVGAPDGTTADPASRLLGMVFGSQQSQVARAIAQEHGLNISSAMELLRMAVPLLLTWLATAQRAGSVDGEAFAGMLRAEAPKLRAYLPGALLGSAAGVARSTVREAERESASDAAVPVVPPRWLVPAAIAAALVLAGLAIRALTIPKEPAAPVATVTAEATNTGETAASNAAIEAATAAVLVAQLAARFREQAAARGDAGDADLERVLAVLDQAVPGGPERGPGVGQCIGPAPCRPVAEVMTDDAVHRWHRGLELFVDGR